MNAFDVTSIKTLLDDWGIYDRTRWKPHELGYGTGMIAQELTKKGVVICNWDHMERLSKFMKVMEREKPYAYGLIYAVHQQQMSEPSILKAVPTLNMRRLREDIKLAYQYFHANYYYGHLLESKIHDELKYRCT